MMYDELQQEAELLRRENARLRVQVAQLETTLLSVRLELATVNNRLFLEECRRVDCDDSSHHGR